MTIEEILQDISKLSIGRIEAIKMLRAKHEMSLATASHYINTLIYENPESNFAKHYNSSTYHPVERGRLVIDLASKESREKTFLNDGQGNEISLQELINMFVEIMVPSHKGGLGNRITYFYAKTITKFLKPFISN
jgi:hypothetical protein